ncbi:uncharacterized protein BJ212DRAFT_1374760 [Suillus subaureus]|uniref:Uncharacterized protein n=1 Tax=Suillus subaureus TaxID=48587 RepID=A0A9P7E5D3_9AGAM|nr:uncharacterized protein BJ212DRAFT_1374760 [Suillus subaureus]KAG1811482.1 hypothetical protein BJ212DRAFT_1374760 [Suillus subaureus]
MAVQKLLLALTILISTCIFALCWGFMIIVWRLEYVILSDSVVNFITRYPTVLTLVSTVISTILSLALTKPQPLLRWNHYKLSIFTLIFVCLVTLLNSSFEIMLTSAITDTYPVAAGQHYYCRHRFSNWISQAPPSTRI